jgi:hypothetical protein
MHDCREVESRLVDLVFDELETDEKLRLLGETESCANCLNTRRSMTGALVVFDRAVEASSPGENYWQSYDNSLRRKLRALDASAQETRVPLWKRIFAASLPVPVPVAAVILVALLVTSVFALRPSTTDAAAMQTHATISSANAVAAPIKIVEVPVVSERIVTRTVYLERKVRGKSIAERPALVAQSRPAASAARAEDEQSGFITRANLAGFEPTSEVKIRMIRRSDEVEK